MARLEKADVIAGAVTALARFPQFGSRIEAGRITACVESAWPDPPHPLVYYLWLAGSDLLGREAAGAVLGSLDIMLELLEKTDAVSGAWRSRVKKLFPSGRGGRFKDHYANFQSALFELLMAFRLWRPHSKVVISGEGKDATCDLSVMAGANRLVAIEAYAPRKWADRAYEDEVAAPWTALVAGIEAPVTPASGAVHDITMNPNAVAEALANVLTDGNFAKQKAKQLASGNGPTLLAIRGYGLPREIHEVLTTKPPLDLAERMGSEAWSRLPAQCKGLLLSYLGDVLKVEGRPSPVAFVPAPGRTISPELWAHLDAADMLTNDVRSQREGLVDRAPATAPTPE